MLLLWSDAYTGDPGPAPAGIAPVEVLVQVGTLELDPVEPATVELEVIVGTVFGGPAPAGTTSGYLVKLATMAGPTSTLEYAKVTSIEWEPNTEEVFELELPKHHAATADLIGDDLVEVQIYRNGKLKAWGPITGDGASANDDAVKLTGRGVYWYVRRRQFGANLASSNRLTNGDFEGPDSIAGLAGWTLGGTHARIGTYSEAEIAGLGLPLLPPYSGERSFFAVGPPFRAARFISQRFIHRAGPGYGNVVRLQGRVNFAFYNGPNLGSLAASGLNVQLWYRDLGENLIALISTGIETTIEGLKADTVGVLHDKWLELDTSLRLPDSMVSAPLIGSIEVRIYLPGGVFAIDSLSATTDGATIPNRGEDQTAFAARLIRYAQTAPGKTDLNLATSTPASGITVGPYPEDSRDAIFVDSAHQKISDAIAELASHPAGFDHAVRYTPTSRTWTTRYPRQGTDRRGALLFRVGRPEDGYLLADWSRSRSWLEVENAIVARGKAEGAGTDVVTIPEGYATDTSGTDGIVLEGVVDAPDTVRPGDLAAYAATEVRDRKDVIPVFDVKTYGFLVDVLETGDLITLEIADGAVLETVDVQIVKIRLEAEPDLLTLTVNVWRADP